MHPVVDLVDQYPTENSLSLSALDINSGHLPTSVSDGVLSSAFSTSTISLEAESSNSEMVVQTST